ncbi:MAG TPA: hypothetical protein VFE07_14765 [Marmoricola sp.]|nr:hypothetical protein [Marmoricola sp.]
MTTQTQTQGLAQPVPAAPAPHVMPRAGSRDGVAPLRNNPAQLLHVVLFAAGAVLLPAGLIVIGLGWYGVAHTPYIYNQNAYIVSGGLLGLGITFVGGFLYFGSWLARVAADQKESQRQLSDTLLLLADAVSQNTAAAAGARPAARPRDPGAVLVVAGRGKTVHRADCDLVAGRDDLKPAGPDAADLVKCRLCMK